MTSLNPKILIIDDDPMVIDLLMVSFKKESYILSAGGSGREAIDLLGKKSFDLVLLDIGLPDMDGYEVMDFITGHHPETFVIVITGDASLDSALEALRRGSYDYIRKPFSIEELQKTVRNALAHKRIMIQQKEGQLALRESEERFRTLVERSPIGICILQNDRVVYQNPEHREIFNMPEEVGGKLAFDCIHPDDADKVRHTYLSFVSGKARTADIDFRFFPSPAEGKSLSMRWVQCRAGSVVYGGEVAILVTTMDLTRAKELEGFVITKSKLISLGRIAAGMAHEIRNPLTGINSYLYNLGDMLNGDCCHPDCKHIIREICSQIQSASNRIEGVIRRVLDFSRPSAPKMTLDDVNRHLRDAVTLSAVTLRKKGIRITESLDEALPRCYADHQMVGQVVLNLITNAAEAMEKQGVSEKEVMIATSFDEIRIHISVGDSGPGIPPRLQDKVFDPFFTTKPDGSGIGLSIAQRIITDHQGAIRVGTSPLGGAEFRIELPIDKRAIPR